LRRILVATVAAAATLAAASALVPGRSAAAAPFPGSTRSHYLTGTGATALSRAGRRDARDSAAAGILDAFVVLGAGEPADAAHVRLPGSGRWAGYGDLRSAVVAYGRGWRAVPGAPPLTLVVMAAAHGPRVGRAAGRQWGRLVGDVAGALPGVDVRGGLDVEVEWEPAARAMAWVDGYLDGTSRGLVDLGSCTCPPLARLPARWSLADLVTIATAGGRGVVVPQIYATAGGNATEWAALARWAARHRRGPVRFAGVLTETAACAGPPVRACAGIDLDPMTAWRQLSDRSGQQLRWASDIGYLSAPGPVHPGLLRPALLAAGAVALAGAVTTLGILAWRTSRRPQRRPRRRRRRPGARRRRRR
jgi:hypothetical protein